MFYSGREILETTGGTLIRGNADTVFEAVSTDTRESQAGRLFIPLKGERFDGHSFIAAAVEKGATGLLIKEGEEGRLREITGNVTVIRVPDTLSALGAVACSWRKKFYIPVVAITGSAGKTTTKEMAACIMGLIKKVLKTEGNLNNLVGLPLTMLKIRNEHEIAILEMGTNQPGEIARLSRIASPDVGLIANIGPAHLEGLKSVDMVREEKGELFRNLSESGIAIVNNDDDAVRTLAKRRQGRKVTYGVEADVDVMAENIADVPTGVNFVLRIGADRDKVSMATVGFHNVMNALAAAAISWALGTDPKTIRRGLQAYNPVPSRMEILTLKNGSFLIDDTYNANPLSVRQALISLKNLKKSYNSVVIMGDMLELGTRAEELHEEVGGFLATTGVATIFLKGELSRVTAAGAKKKGFPAERIFFPSTGEEIVGHLSRLLEKGDWVLVKGSRAMRMEEIVKSIVETFGLRGEHPRE